MVMGVGGNWDVGKGGGRHDGGTYDGGGHGGCCNGGSCNGVGEIKIGLHFVSFYQKYLG